MKYSLIFCGLMLTIQGQTFAQSNESLTYSSQRQQYKQQSKTGTIMGVVLLSTGLTLGYIGINQNLSNISILSNSRSGEGSAAFFMGLTLALSSVPVFIVAANNKRKSTLYLKQEKVQLPLPNTIINNAALVWRIPL